MYQPSVEELTNYPAPFEACQFVSGTNTIMFPDVYIRVKIYTHIAIHALFQIPLVHLIAMLLISGRG